MKKLKLQFIKVVLDLKAGSHRVVDELDYSIINDLKDVVYNIIDS